MKTIKIFSAALLAIAFASCGGNQNKGLADGASGDLEAYENGDVNAIVQAMPQIMVIPGDQTLQTFKCLKNETVNGRSYVIRDFQNYLLKDYRARRIISTIQDAFIDVDFPLNDFEQTLKQLDTLQEQPVKIDIRKELASIEFMGVNDARDTETIARHFYALGQQSKEQPVCEGLEKEIYNYANSIAEGTPLFEIIPQTARHFAKWGAEHLKK